MGAGNPNGAIKRTITRTWNTFNSITMRYILSRIDDKLNTERSERGEGHFIGLKKCLFDIDKYEIFYREAVGDNLERNFI